MASTRRLRLMALLLILAHMQVVTARELDKVTKVPAPAATELTVQKDRAILIQGEIGNGNLLRLTPKLMELASDGSHRPVDLIINSPGGELLTGYLFVDIMEAVKAKGTPIRCFVPVMAASMAFQLLLHCNERYSLDNSLLLWHGARIFSGGGVITQEIAQSLADNLAETNKDILVDIDRTLGKYLSSAEIRKHFMLETLHRGASLEALAPGFIDARPYIRGLLEVVLDPQTVRAPDANLRKLPGTIIHEIRLGREGK